MRIVAGHDGGSGCGYYRIIQPLAELARHGWETDVVSAQRWRATGDGIGVEREPDFTAARMEGADVIVGQRLDNYAGLAVWRRARKPGTRLVYEVDDDIFTIEQVNFGAWKHFQSADAREAVSTYAQMADLVTVTTEPLAETMRRFNPNVAVINNHIPGWVLDLPAPEGDRPAVGWHGGVSHGMDIQLIARPVRQFLERNPGWDSVLIGADYRPTVKHPRCGYIPWTHVTDDAEGFYRSIDFDIGLAPLRPSAFTAQKSHIKALEYAARGIPVIASDTEPYRDFVLHGVTGFLVRRDHEWLRYMEELARDPELRASMGAKAKEAARAWTIDEGWTRWRDAYEGLF
jgi:glycosyltransferase involved in cell wall biosynthesis